MTDSNPAGESAGGPVPSLAALRGLTDAELDGLAHAHPDAVRLRYYRYEQSRRRAERAFRSLQIFDRALVAVTILALAATILALAAILPRLLR